MFSDTSSSTSIDQEKVSRRSSESSMSKMTDDNSFEVNIIEEVDLENETGGSKSHHAQSNNNDSVITLCNNLSILPGYDII